MSGDYDGEPLDFSWQSDLKDANTDRGRTVGGTADPEPGDLSTDNWPSKLPKSPFTRVANSADDKSKQQKVVEAMVLHPNAEDESISKIAKCDPSYVGDVRGKVSVYVPPRAVPFDIPELPTKSRLTDAAISDKQSRFREDSISKIRGEDDNRQGADDGSTRGGAELSERICERYYDEGESAESIADDLGLSENQVTGRLSYRAHRSDNKESNVDRDDSDVEADDGDGGQTGQEDGIGYKPKPRTIAGDIRPAGFEGGGGETQTPAVADGAGRDGQTKSRWQIITLAAVVAVLVARRVFRRGGGQ